MYQNTSKDALHGNAKKLLGQNVKRIRVSLGLSQEELGLRIGADQAYISRLESGQINPTLETMSELAHSLHTKTQGLLCTKPQTGH